jgi:hypothetical protein
MALNEVPGLILSVHGHDLVAGSCDHDAKSSVCRPQAAVAPQFQSVTGPWSLARLFQPPGLSRIPIIS